MGKEDEYMEEERRKESRREKRVDARVVDRARLENEQSKRLVGSNPTLPDVEKEVMAEWLNATDCNFVPITVRRFKSFSPQEKKGKSRRFREKKKERERKDD